MDSITLIPGNATTPQGFQAHGLRCGVRAQEKDLALLWCDSVASAAGMFTTNQVKAAPLLVCQEALSDGRARCVLVNSGNANACTGKQGMADAREMVQLASYHLDIAPSEVLLCSTGLIGRTLPMDKLRSGIPLLKEGLSKDGGQRAAEAIMTTDAFIKTQAAVATIKGKEFHIGGMAKGAGMIHPKLATTLGFLTTDVTIAPKLLKEALASAMDVSFNSITVDGDTSTNDTVLVLAGGCSEVEIHHGESLEIFISALTQVAQALAKMVVKDGEGARRLVELVVSGAPSVESAKRVAETIAGSLLVKTMLVGGEPNWGRVIAAAGRSGVTIEPDKMALWFGDTQVVEGGLGLPANLQQAATVLQAAEVRILLDLGLGPAESTIWTCDINEKYVVLNGSYMT
jgi:glutamate N-acetyltransferase / amino-acid N-acetyltransferase